MESTELIRFIFLDCFRCVRAAAEYYKLRVISFYFQSLVYLILIPSLIVTAELGKLYLINGFSLDLSENEMLIILMYVNVSVLGQGLLIELNLNGIDKFYSIDYFYFRVCVRVCVCVCVSDECRQVDSHFACCRSVWFEFSIYRPISMSKLSLKNDRME